MAFYAKSGGKVMEFHIQNVILQMDKPFLLSDLFDVLEKKGISNKDLILQVLDELLNRGLVEYSDFDDDEGEFAIYHSKFAAA